MFRALTAAVAAAQAGRQASKPLLLLSLKSHSLVSPPSFLPSFLLFFLIYTRGVCGSRDEELALSSCMGAEAARIEKFRPNNAMQHPMDRLT